MQQTNRSRHRHITSFQVISLGFLSVILLGSLLLMLPIATKSGQSTSFSDALFTATSAVCVTGLVIKDTATYWSLFGQGVILLLIQIGGMGIITIAIAIAVVSGRKIGLMQRSTMQEAKSDVCYELIRAMQLVGINVITRTEVEECFAIIDDEIVWHGGMNLLGKADVWDNLMRIRNSQVATELLEIALGCSEERRKSE